MSSRPVSARRPGHDIPEKIVVREHLQPRTINEAKSRSRVSMQELLGSISVTILFFAFGLTTFILWISSYIVPYGTYVRADCLVLNSTQTMLSEGFQREPLYRAEVYVYVFNTSLPKCCCKNSFGKERCAEWEAVSYDTPIETHTPGDKWDFLRQYGYPSTFHKCWHSPDKEKVLLRSLPFLRLRAAPSRMRALTLSHCSMHTKQAHKPVAISNGAHCRLRRGHLRHVFLISESDGIPCSTILCGQVLWQAPRRKCIATSSQHAVALAIAAASTRQ